MNSTASCVLRSTRHNGERALNKTLARAKRSCYLLKKFSGPILLVRPDWSMVSLPARESGDHRRDGPVG